ncbi:PRK06851 family protein [Microbacteriaceae bacterium 4G12]
MTAKMKNYYASGNTARGLYSLYEQVLQGLDHVFILKGIRTGKSSIMKEIGKEWFQNGYDIEFLHCPSDNHAIDGVIIPELKVAIIDGSVPHGINSNAPGVVEKYIDAWNLPQLAGQQEEIVQYRTQMNEAFELAYSHFAEALQVHDEWEEIYIQNMDFEKADQLTKQLINILFAEKAVNKKACVQHRFLGAATPKGAVDFIQDLTEDVPKRYFIKGRPGSGKSTMLKQLAANAEQRGFDVEVYHCGFDPNSLDMIIVRQLDIAIFDSTAPHEYFPSRESDEIIDMYEAAITPGTDEKYASDIQTISTRYATRMKEAISYLAKAKNVQENLEKIYSAAMDCTKLDVVREEIHSEIQTIAQVIDQQHPLS